MILGSSDFFIFLAGSAAAISQQALIFNSVT